VERRESSIEGASLCSAERARRPFPHERSQTLVHSDYGAEADFAVGYAVVGFGDVV